MVLIKVQVKVIVFISDPFLYVHKILTGFSFPNQKFKEFRANETSLRFLRFSMAHLFKNENTHLFGDNGRTLKLKDAKTMPVMCIKFRYKDILPFNFCFMTPSNALKNQ